MVIFEIKNQLTSEPCLLVSYRFDSRITKFATEKFERDGIDVKTGSMVIKVSDKHISTKEIKTGQTVSIPYGMVLWSTGIATRPVIMDFMKQIGQVCFLTTIYISMFPYTSQQCVIGYSIRIKFLWSQGNRRVLATDEWLRVEGCDGVYALGDCATINQRKVMVNEFRHITSLCYKIRGLSVFICSNQHLALSIDNFHTILFVLTVSVSLGQLWRILLEGALSVCYCRLSADELNKFDFSLHFTIRKI